MKQTNIYVLIGEPTSDLLIYLSALWNNLKQKVLILNTKEVDIKQCNNSLLQKNQLFHDKWYDCILISSIPPNFQNKYEIDDYDVVLIMSETIQKELLYFTNITMIFVMNYEKKVVENTMTQWNHWITCIKEINLDILEEQKKVLWIFRDSSASKIDERYIQNVYCQEDVVSIPKLILPWDEIDYGYRIQMEYESIVRFLHISKPLKQCIFQIVTKQIIIPLSILKRAWKDAERGKYIENSVLE